MSEPSIPHGGKPNCAMTVRQAVVLQCLACGLLVLFVLTGVITADLWFNIFLPVIVLALVLMGLFALLEEL